MRKSLVNVTLTSLALLLLFAFNALALAPETMVYQGRLADTDGNPITNGVDVTFTIYLSSDGDAVDSVWAEQMAVTPDNQGVFTAELGATVPLTTDIFTGGPRFLAIKVAGDAEMIPRQLLASAPYAINSNIADGSVTSAKITNGTIVGADISNSAAIFPSKISGTAATLSANQRFTGTNYFGDSTMTVNATGVRMGDALSPISGSLLKMMRHYNHTSGLKYGIWADVFASGDGGGLVGAFFGATSTAGAAGVKYAVYGRASGTGTNYAGYFDGNATVTGTLSKGGGSFKIDHPTDPTNKYLYHSFVESPDMMNVYNGNITTDAGGYAIVELPDYFKALNKDFRYQLTVIGDFAQAIIAEEINDNQFTIRTDKPSVKVSWQVTGVRKDAFAEANRIKVEVEKPAIEKGLYLHPEAFKLGQEMQIHHNLIKNMQETAGDGHE